MVAATSVRPVISGIVIAVTAPSGNWLGGILAARGHTVVEHLDAPTAVQRILDEDGDLLIISADLPHDGPVGLCLALRDRAGGDRPVVVESSTGLPDGTRLNLMAAGAWECVARDDPRLNEQVLRLEACLRFRRATARERLGMLTDPSTGLYNRLGLSRRARELGAQVFRSHDPLACVVFSLALHPDTEASMAACARAVHEEGRDSDIVARLGDREIAILAPRTDADGVVRLAERIARALCPSRPLDAGDIRVDLRAAFDAVPGIGFVAIRPIDLVIRAALTLRERGQGPPGQWLWRSGGHPRPAET